jgi:translation initiation factor 5A
MSKKLEAIGDLKEGRYIIIDNEPCKVTNTKHSAPGKHGHGKVRMEAVGIFDDKKRVIVKPSDARVEVPLVEKKGAQIISISGDNAQVMDLDTYETFELEIPPELKDKVEEGKQLMYWTVLGRKMMKQLK